jgi:hypothetical protein
MPLMLALLAVVPALAAEDVSLFGRSAERVTQDGSFACEQRPLGKRIANRTDLCGLPLESWRSFSLSLLELPAYRNRNARERDLKDVVARNIRITEAYAQLYLLSLRQAPVCGRSVLPWVGGASLGSLKSGQVMRSALSSYYGAIPEFDRLRDANYRPRFEERFTPMLAGFALESASLTLGQGNRAIFADLYWQLLAGATCGPEQVLRTIKASPGWEQDEKLVRSARTWERLFRASQTCDEAEIIEANKGFVEVEQYLVGQEAMYEGLTRQFGGWILSPMIEPAMPASLGRFPTFSEHAGQRYPHYRVSFADPEQRVPWMKDQLAVMQGEFRAKQNFLPSLFCAAVRDSEEAEKVIGAL